MGSGRRGTDEEVRWDLVDERDVAGKEVRQIFGRGRLCEEITCQQRISVVCQSAFGVPIFYRSECQTHSNS